MPNNEQQNTDFEQKFNIGDIVALITHPYFGKNIGDIIYISGDPLLISPLMVITETLKEGKFQYDENIGINLTRKESYQYKCIWYSQKNHSFEEAWLSSKLLKLIPNLLNEQKLSIGSIKSIGNSVILKTAKVELGKKKSSFSVKGTNKNDSNKTITSLLSFIPPVMQVIGTVKSESKEPFLDAKTGRVKREISSLLIKCKFYNPSSDKMSEVLVPIEALEVVTTIMDTIFELLKTSIENKTHLVTHTNDKEHPNRIISPSNINYRSGFYFLEGLDLLINKSVEIEINGNDLQFEAVNAILYKLPDFKVKNKAIVANNINISSINILPKNKYWIIKYIDFYDNVTIRTIFNQSMIELECETEDGVIVKDTYLQADCILRNHERYFRIDKILEIKVLDLLF